MNQTTENDQSLDVDEYDMSDVELGEETGEVPMTAPKDKPFVSRKELRAGLEGKAEETDRTEDDTLRVDTQRGGGMVVDLEAIRKKKKEQYALMRKLDRVHGHHSSRGCWLGVVILMVLLGAVTAIVWLEVVRSPSSETVSDNISEFKETTAPTSVGNESIHITGFEETTAANSTSESVLEIEPTTVPCCNEFFVFPETGGDGTALEPCAEGGGIEEGCCRVCSPIDVNGGDAEQLASTEMVSVLRRRSQRPGHEFGW